MFSLRSMKLGASLLLATTLSPFAAATTLSDWKALPGGYIVEFATGGQSDFYANLTDNNIDTVPRMSLNHKLFNGASFHIADYHNTKENVDSIISMDIVKDIWPIHTFTINKISNFDVRQSGLKKRNLHSYTDNFSTHIMTGVNKLHAEGYTGDGLFIGMIDSGIDYNHPALGGCFGKGCKVVTGYDLVGDNFDVNKGNTTPNPDHDPMDCDGHGTATAGVLAAGGNSRNFTGVAPNATLGMWKAFDCNGQTSTDITIAAFNMAYEAGVDLISASLGEINAWSEDPLAVTVQRIVENGVPVICAAGNQGRNGIFTINSPSSVSGATAVAAVQNSVYPDILYRFEWGSDSDCYIPQEVYYVPDFSADFGDTIAKLWAVSLNSMSEEATACNPLPKDTPDLSGFVVLVQQSLCDSDLIVSNILEYGAISGLLFYEKGTTTTLASFSTEGITSGVPSGNVFPDLAATWISELSAGNEVLLSFTPVINTTVKTFNLPNNGDPGLIPSWSSMGPTYELLVKPDVSAPGGIILTTDLLKDGGYVVEDGTSFAAPFISGCVALIMQVRGVKTLLPAQINSLLSTTANPTFFDGPNNISNLYAPVIQGGGGLVDAYTAAHTKTILNIGIISLNDTTNFIADHEIIIENHSDNPVVYEFFHTRALTIYTLNLGSVTPANFSNIQTEADETMAASVTFTPERLTISGRSSGIVTLHFTLPQHIEASRIPIYSGFIYFNATNANDGTPGDSITLPYAGVAQDMKDVTILDTDNGFPRAIQSDDNTYRALPNDNMVFTIPYSNLNTSINNTNWPGIAWQTVMGTRSLRVDAVPADDKTTSSANLTTILGEQVIGAIPEYPWADLVTGSSGVFSFWNGTMADGSIVPEGKYKFMLRALKILGDQDNGNDYEKYVTGAFTLKYS